MCVGVGAGGLTARGPLGQGAVVGADQTARGTASSHPRRLSVRVTRGLDESFGHERALRFSWLDAREEAERPGFVDAEALHHDADGTDR